MLKVHPEERYGKRLQYLAAFRHGTLSIKEHWRKLLLVLRGQGRAVADAKFVFIQERRSSVEDRRRRRVAFEEAAKKMLRYLEDSEDLKVGVSDLKEQLGISDEAGMTIRQIAQQAMNENGQKIFHSVKQGEEEVSGEVGKTA